MKGDDIRHAINAVLGIFSTWVPGWEGTMEGGILVPADLLTERRGPEGPPHLKMCLKISSLDESFFFHHLFHHLFAPLPSLSRVIGRLRFGTGDHLILRIIRSDPSHTARDENFGLPLLFLFLLLPAAGELPLCFLPACRQDARPGSPLDALIFCLLSVCLYRFARSL